MKIGNKDFKDMKMGEMMYWTLFVKRAAYVALVLGILGSLIFAFKSDSAGIAILAFIGGLGGSLMSVSGVMMMCEISENLYLLRINSEKTSAPSNTSIEKE